MNYTTNYSKNNIEVGMTVIVEYPSLSNTGKRVMYRSTVEKVTKKFITTVNGNKYFVDTWEERDGSTRIVELTDATRAEYDAQVAERNARKVEEAREKLATLDNPKRSSMDDERDWANVTFDEVITETEARRSYQFTVNGQPYITVTQKKVSSYDIENSLHFAKCVIKWDKPWCEVNLNRAQLFTLAMQSAMEVMKRWDDETAQLRDMVASLAKETKRAELLAVIAQGGRDE